MLGVGWCGYGWTGLVGGSACDEVLAVEVGEEGVWCAAA